MQDPRSDEANPDWFRLLFERAPVGMDIAGLDQRYVEVNDAMCAFLGYTRDELVGRRFVEVTHPDDRWVNPHAYSAVLAGDLPWFSHEKRYVRKDGSPIWLRVSFSAIRDDHGVPVATFAVTQDITDARRAAAAHQQAEVRLQLLASQTSDVIFRVDFDRARPGVYLTPAIEAVTGHAPERWEVDGYELLEQLAGPAVADSILRRFLSPEAIPDQPVRFTLPDGRAVHFHVRVRKELGTDGTVQAIEGIARDVTALETAREQLERAARLELIGRLASGVAHDFNNLLTAVMGHAERLVHALGPADDRSELAGAIVRSCEVGAALTSGLLALARTAPVDAVVVDVAAALRRFVPVLQRLVAPTVGLGVEFDDDLPPVRMSPGGIEQILMNLVGNASDAMPDGGTVTVRAEVAGDRLRMTVHDTGGGIAEEIQQRVFEPFFTTKEAGRGTGLGLATVKGLVESHGGRVSLTSRPGAGTAVAVDLPVVSGATPTSRPLADGAGGEAARALVVDDNPGVLGVVTAVLRHEGYEVVAADDPDEALARARGHPGPFAVAVCDVVMPGTDGRTLGRTLLAEGRAEVVVLISGNTEDGGGLPLLAKPFTATQLIQAVRRARADVYRRP